MSLTQSLDSVQIVTFHFEGDGQIPNHPMLPMIVYRAVLRLDAYDPAATAEKLFLRNGWQGMWRNGIFDFPHYHSNAHEVLAICRGAATVRFGGAHGVTLVIQAGDVALLPAGTGHQRLSASGDLLVVGAYPPEQVPDLCQAEKYVATAEYEALRTVVQAVPLPTSDPIYGPIGPLFAQWGGTAVV